MSITSCYKNHSYDILYYIIGGLFFQCPFSTVLFNVQTGTGVFYIKVDNGSVSLIEKGESGWTVSEDSAILTFTAASADSPATVTVGNDSGSALPSTGSHGTAIYYIAGFALIALASVFPVAKKIRDR